LLKCFESVCGFVQGTRNDQTKLSIRQRRNESIRFDFFGQAIRERIFYFVGLEEMGDRDDTFQGGNSQVASLSQHGQKPRFESCGIYSALPVKDLLSFFQETFHCVTLSAARQDFQSRQNFNKMAGLILLQFATAMNSLLNFRRRRALAPF
jgi:hypothetical protein